MISELDERLKKARPTRRNESRVVYVEGGYQDTEPNKLKLGFRTQKGQKSHCNKC